MYEGIGIGYVVLATIIFTAQWIILALKGLNYLQRTMTRGIEEEIHDIQLGVAARADIVRAEIREAFKS